MSAVTVRLPAVLSDMVGGERQVEVAGDTIGEALHDLVRRRPQLALHFFDEAGALRRHILCFHGDVYTSRSDGLDRSVRPGDTLTILNSVAGG